MKYFLLIIKTQLNYLFVGPRAQVFVFVRDKEVMDRSDLNVPAVLRKHRERNCLSVKVAEDLCLIILRMRSVSASGVTGSDCQPLSHLLDWATPGLTIRSININILHSTLTRLRPKLSLIGTSWDSLYCSLTSTLRFGFTGTKTLSLWSLWPVRYNSAETVIF